LARVQSGTTHARNAFQLIIGKLAGLLLSLLGRIFGLFRGGLQHMANKNEMKLIVFAYKL